MGPEQPPFEPPPQQPQNMMAAGAQVAGSFLDTMKAQPMMLAVLVLNAIFVGFLFYSMTTITAERTVQMTAIMERCMPPRANGPH